MKLTRRQEEFIQNLVDLNHILDGPIHYSVLAERLGVSPFTAYDMLRLLEEKGMVTSAYHLPEERSGPGRAERVFFATEKGRAHRERILAKSGGQAPTLEILSDAMLDDLCQGEHWDMAMVEALLAGAALSRTGLSRYGVELMVIVALRLRRSPARASFEALLPDLLPEDRPATAVDLSLLGGYALGFLTREGAADDEWLQELAVHVRRYQEHVLSLSLDACRQLGEDVRGALYLVWNGREVVWEPVAASQ
jgi:DNA-binding Lrp family transcriptional regulator